MKTYWFLRFSAFAKDEHGSLRETKGNAVFMFPLSGFLPKRAVEIIKDALEKEVQQRGWIRNSVFVILDFVLEIDECGYYDFAPGKIMDESQVAYAFAYVEYSNRVNVTVRSSS